MVPTRHTGPVIYLDHNASSPLAPEVALCLEELLGNAVGNPSSLHGPGREVSRRVEAARLQVARSLNTGPSQVVFTSGGTESLSLALQGVLGAWERPSLPEIVTTRAAHAATREACALLEKQGRIRWVQVGIDEKGRWTPENILGVVGPNTALVSVLAAHNEVGTLYPVEALARKLNGPALLVDAVQAYGKIPLNVESLGADFVALSGHKVGTLQGVGSLWVKRGASFEPPFVGGGQERGRRGGTPNVPGILSMGLVAEALEARVENVLALAGIRDSLEKRLGTLPGVECIGGGTPRLSNTLLMRFDGIDAEDLRDALDTAGVVVGTGSACSSARKEPSPTLKAMGFTNREASEAIRFSFGPEMSVAMGEEVAKTVEACVVALRCG